ncbi:MAG: PIN domain-containing protein [Thiomargarita sp.]|nr:PIN domain-containing protein [Thiomargarita sp.]
MILLDTPILSAAYRRKYRDDSEKPPEVFKLQEMIKDNEPLAIPGIVVQEFLSGLREPAQFEKLQVLIEGFPIILATEEHHIEAAKIANICRRNGVTTSATDCLIAAIAIEKNAQLFTMDRDFVYMAAYCSIHLLPKPSVQKRSGG